MTASALQTIPERESAIGAVPLNEVVNQVEMIQKAMSSVMQEGTHFGKVPGCGDKPTLLQPGAQKLSLMFRLAPHFDSNGGSIKITDLPNSHRLYDVVCAVVNIHTGEVWATGVGSCSTMESKYRYRTEERKCPKCGKEAIKKSKFPPRGAPAGSEPGWYCYGKIGGCGAEFAANDTKITEQKTGRVEYDNPYDYYNTVKKMACKRAFVAATLSATAAGDIFTQDVEDIRDNLQAVGAVAEVVEPTQEPQGTQAPKAQEPASTPAPTSAQPPMDIAFHFKRLCDNAKIEWEKFKTQVGKNYPGTTLSDALKKNKEQIEKDIKDGMYDLPF